MSSMPTSTGTPAKMGGTKGLIMIVVVVVILAAAAYLIFGSGGYKPGSTAKPNSPAAGQNEQTATPSAVPNEVYSYVGTVEKVSNGQITVMAKKDLNLLDADATLTVKADANTQVIKRTIPKVLPAEGGAGLFKQEDITVSDISVGDQVTVVSSTNVRGKTEFTASRIEVLNVQ